MPDIPTKSYTCMSTSWLLGIVYTAKSCKGEKFLTLQNWDWSAKGDNPDRKSSFLQDSWGWAWG